MRFYSTENDHSADNLCIDTNTKYLTLKTVIIFKVNILGSRICVKITFVVFHL